MSADSAVTYTSVHSEARSWSIPSEDPYEELEDHVPAHIPERPEDLVSAEDEAPIEAYIPEVASAPTHPLPPSFLTPRIRPPHTRAAMAQMRAAVPSTSRRVEISKANTPPQKRLLLTAPRPGCEKDRAAVRAEIEALIDRGVAAAMAEAEATRVRNGYDSNGSGPRLAQAVRECTYLDFLKCQPLKFKGIEGVVGLTQWFKKIKSVFNINNCTETCQVKYAACTLQGVALTWWNSHVKTVTLEESNRVEKYIDGLPNTIHDSVKATRRKTMQEAIEFATELMDKRIRDVVENK
nr:hypothetical protein [Tanacetum cinerariifolium]